MYKAGDGLSLRNIDLLSYVPYIYMTHKTMCRVRREVRDCMEREVLHT